MERIERVNRHSERSRHDRGELYRVLDAGHHVGSLSTVVDDKPWVVPILYAWVGDRILMHGSVGAGALRRVSAGVPAALCVAHIDGLVYAHTLFDSSANYRSAVVHGSLTALDGDDARRAMTDLSDCIMPGRSAEVPDHTKKQMAATMALVMDIVDGQWTVKIREENVGKPSESECNPELWTGVLPIVSAYGTPQAAPHHVAGLPISPSILECIRSSRHRVVV